MPTSTPASFRPLGLPFLFCAGLAWTAGALPSARAASIPVPNYSFENPTANSPGFPVNVDLDNWIDTAPRSDYAGQIPWGWGTGNFPNPDVGQSNRLTNMDGNRAAFLLASRELGFYQELTSPDGVFAIGQSYKLTIGVSPEEGTPVGTVLSLSLYYSNAGQIIPIATTPVPFFTDTNTFIDFSVLVPTVQASDAWAGKPIGIMLQTTTVPAENGGFDIDNVRVESVPEPTTGVLAGLGLALLSVRRRTRRA